MRIWNKSAAGGGVAHPFEEVEPGVERRVCNCKTAEWRWVDAGSPGDRDKCRGGLILERDEALEALAAGADERRALRSLLERLSDVVPDGYTALHNEIGEALGLAG